MPQVGLQERAVGLVDLPGLHDQLAHGVLVRVQEALGEARGAVRGPRVLNPDAVEGGSDAGSGPDVHLLASQGAQLLGQGVFAALELLDELLAARAVKADALAGEVDQHRQQLGFELEDGFQLVALEQGAQVVPELERQGCVLLGVLSDVHGGELPEFLFRVDSEVGGGFLEALLGLGFFEVVESKGVEAEAESVFVDERRGEHRVVDGAVDFEALREEPAVVVGGVVHDLVAGQLKNATNETLDSLSVKVPSTLMRDGEVSGPSVNSKGVADNETVTTWPSWSHRFHVGVAGFEVNCNLLGAGEVREHLGRNPLGRAREHVDGSHRRNPLSSFLGSTMCSAFLARVMPT
jgi:hypothetical protein